MDQTKKVKVLHTRIPAHSWISIGNGVKIYNEKSFPTRLKIETTTQEEQPLIKKGEELSNDKK